MKRSECHSVSRTLNRRSRELRRAKDITHAPDGLDKLRGMVAIKRIAQSINEHVHKICPWVEFILPQPLEEVSLGKRTALIAHEQFKQCEFARRQLNPHAVATDRAIDEIEQHAL